MRFTPQDVEGRRVLLAEGEIDDNMLPRLESALDRFDGDEIWIRSSGGNERVAKQAGILIRNSGLSTHIPAGWTCYGACNFMFLGGIGHTVDERGTYMVQTPPLLDLTDAEAAAGGSALANEIAEQAAQMASDDNGYLIRMGVSRRLLVEVMYVGAEDGSRRRCLSREELERYNVHSRVYRPT
jgi:hypothetical protein